MVASQSQVARERSMPQGRESSRSAGQRGKEDSILDLTASTRIFGATSIYFIAKEQ